MRAQLEEALALAQGDPRNADANGRVAMLLHSYELLAGADVWYRRAELQSDSFRWPYLRSQVLAANGDVDAALASLDRALSLEPSYPRAHSRRVELLLERGDIVACKTALAAMGDAREGRAEVDYLKAQLALRQNEPELAISALNTVLASSGDFPALHSAYAQAYRMLGQQEAVSRHVQLAERSRGQRVDLPDPVLAEVLRLDISTTARIQRAKALAARGSPASARTLLEEALADDPTSLPILVSLAGLLASEREFDRAEALLTAASGIDSEHPSVLYAGGLLQLRRGELSSAETAFKRSADQDPSDANAWAQLGFVREMLGKPDEAMSAYRQAMAQDRWHRQGNWRLGRLLLARGEANQALRYLQSVALAVDPASAPILLDTARALSALGREEEAKARLREAIGRARQFSDTRNLAAAQELLRKVEGQTT